MKKNFIITCLLACTFTTCFADDIKITNENFISTLQNELNKDENKEMIEQLSKKDTITLNFEKNPTMMENINSFITDNIDQCIKKFSDEVKIDNVVQNNFQTKLGKVFRKMLINEINVNLFGEEYKKNNFLDDWCLMHSPKKENTMIMMPICNIKCQKDTNIALNISCWYDTKEKTTTLKRIKLVHTH